MGAIRAGGLASGLDTNNIIESLVESAKEPIYKLNNKSHLLGLEKILYKSINSDLTAMKQSVFDLKLESTFKSKKITSSNSSIASAKVGTAASKGTHVIEVLQRAENAKMTSKFTNVALGKLGAGISKINGLPSIYDQLEGVHDIEVYTDANGKSVALSTFKPENGQTYDLAMASKAISSSFIDSNGKIIDTSKNHLELEININGKTVTIMDDNAIDFTNIKDINTLYSVIEASVNSAINNVLGTTGDQHVALRALYDENTQEWSTAMYYTSEEIFTINAVNNGSLDEYLGMNDPVNMIKTTGILKTVVADNLDDLQEIFEDEPYSNIISGTWFDFGSAGLSNGKFQIIQDASMNVKRATKSTVTGAAHDGTLDLSKRDLKESGISTESLSGLEGVITINGVKINIPSSEKVSINDVMAMVNGAGAGVVMSFDANSNKFILESNKTGAVNITLGDTSDTSSLFDVFKLTAADGALKEMGSNKGSINTSSPISQAGFTYGINSGIFTINDVPIYIDVTKDSVEDIIKKVNGSGAGVTLSYDGAKDKFEILSDGIELIKFGSDGNDTSNALLIMGFTNSTGPSGEAAYFGKVGQNAIVKVDGNTYHRSSNTVDDIINGVELNLTSVGVTTLEIDVDTDKAIDALASFIKHYNSLLIKLRPSDISKDDREDKMGALSESDKKSMSEDDLAKYNKEYDELHTASIIQRSSGIRNLMKSMRSNATDAVNNGSAFKSLVDMGIKVAGDGDITITRLGLLVTKSTDLDEIKKALKDNEDLVSNLTNSSDDVYNLFANYEEVTDPETKKTTLVKDSWARKFENVISNAQDIQGNIGVKTRADNALDRQMDRISKEIDKQTRRAEDYLERLWREFAAMEKRVAAIQSQGQYLSQITGNQKSA